MKKGDNIMLIDLNGKFILNLNGTKTTLTMANPLSEIIMDPKQNFKEFNAVRRYEIARIILMEQKIDLLVEDANMLIRIVKNTDMFGSLVTAQLELELKAIKDAYDEKMKAKLQPQPIVEEEKTE